MRRIRVSWRKAYIWPCLEKYHDLKRTFWILVNCPVGILRLLHVVWFYNYHKLILQGGKNGGFSEKILSDIYYKTTKNTVRQFVIQFRCTCKNQANWRKAYIWPCLEKYHDLKRTFWILVNCPVGILRLLHVVWMQLRKIKNVLH
jgi:hypothetical protein